MDIFKRESKLDRFLTKLTPWVFLSVAILYTANVSINWRPEWDSAYYMILAESLLEGEGFTYLNYPCLKIPFGFPLLIAPVMHFTDNFLILNIFILLFVGIAFFAIYRSFGKTYTPVYALIVAALTAWSSLSLFYAGYVMIEFPFIAFSFLSLYFALLYSKRPTLPSGIAAVTFLLASFFLRTVGIALIGGIFVYFLLHRIKIMKTVRFAALTLLLLIPIGLWIVQNRSADVDNEDPVWQLQEFIPSREEAKRFRFDDPMSSVNGAGDLIRRAVLNGQYYGAITSTVLLGFSFRLKREDFENPSSWSYITLLGIAALLTLTGFLLSLKQKRTVFDYYFILYMGILMAWSAREPRYILPVLPMLLHYFLTGFSKTVAYISNRVSPRLSPQIAQTAVVLFSVLYLVLNSVQNHQIIKEQHRADYYPYHMKNFLRTADWLKHNTEKDAKVVSVLAPISAYFSKRWTVSFPRVKNEQKIASFLHRIDADYLVVNPSYAREEKYLEAVVDSFPHLFRKLSVTGEAVVYSIDRNKLEKLHQNSRNIPLEDD
ncbi:MAG: hypothetical protein ACOCW1_03460 [Chitinispirillaceae bacterium]